MFETINNDNVLLYAMKCYNSPRCIMSEFEEDYKRIKYIKRLFKKYRTTKDLKERLILNHMIVLSNVFGTECAVRLLFFKIDSSDYDILKTFCIYLNYMPNIVYGIGDKNIVSSNIKLDMDVADKLRKL